MDNEEINKEVLEQIKSLKEREEEARRLSQTLGNILTQNVELSQEDYKVLKNRVSKACDENGKPICLREMRKRVQENFYGTSINFQVTMLGLLGDIYDQQQEDHNLLVQLIKKLTKEE